MTLFIDDQYRNAIEIVERYGLTSEVIYEMTINGLSPIQALYEWDLI